MFSCTHSICNWNINEIEEEKNRGLLLRHCNLHRTALSVWNENGPIRDDWAPVDNWIVAANMIFAIASSRIRRNIAISDASASIEGQTTWACVQRYCAEEAQKVLRASVRHRQQAEWLVRRTLKAPGLAPFKTLFGFAVEKSIISASITYGSTIITLIVVCARLQIMSSAVASTITWIHIVLRVDDRRPDERQRHNSKTVVHYFFLSTLHLFSPVFSLKTIQTGCRSITNDCAVVQRNEIIYTFFGHLRFAYLLRSTAIMSRAFWLKMYSPMCVNRLIKCVTVVFETGNDLELLSNRPIVHVALIFERVPSISLSYLRFAIIHTCVRSKI